MAERLHISVKTLIRRMAEARVRGITPVRHRLLSEADIDCGPISNDAPTSLAWRTPPGVPADIRRQLHRAETSWPLNAGKGAEHGRWGDAPGRPRTLARGHPPRSPDPAAPE